MKPAFRLTVLLVVLSVLPAVRLHAQEGTPVYTVLFTHIEDNTPGGLLGSQQNRQSYLTLRARLIQLAVLARDSNLPWSLQPDWKILEAALLYEDSTVTATTNGKNFLRYLKEDLGAVIDPHSHENGGYNYTDVAHLLDSLGVGATTVIGGHIWDPDLPQFQEWDRFRVPVAGERYPWATWQGDILMGSGTPNHVNDPILSGLWRPRDRDHYFEDDSTANIVAVGSYRGTIESISELSRLYDLGIVPTECMLTTTCSIRPVTILSANGIATIQDSIMTPIMALRDAGNVVPTDFTSLVETWRTSFGAKGTFFNAEAAGIGDPIPGIAPARVYPNPFTSTASMEYTVSRETWVRVHVFDVLGRRVAELVDERQSPGTHVLTWDARALPSGSYFLRFQGSSEGGAGPSWSRKVVLAR